MLYRFSEFPADFFWQNRQDFFGFMPNDSVAVFHSLDVYPISADGYHTFVQSTDLYYLSGIDQAETSLILHKNSKGTQTSILFVKESTDESIIWEGIKFSLSEAKKMSKVDKVYWNVFFDRKSIELLMKTKNIFVNRNTHTRAENSLKNIDERWADIVESKFTDKKILKSDPILSALRIIKKEPEIAAIRKACQITNEAFVSCLNNIKYGMLEYEIEAHFSYHFLKNGCRGFAYEPIVASGKDNCVLHYTKNNKPIKNGDLILMDIGAKYANYSADMTRVIPVSGKFSIRQKEVYDAVNKIKVKAETLLNTQYSFEEYKNQVVEKVNLELVDLGLISKKELVREENTNAAYRKYFMHGVSHHLGLDTHDYGQTKGSIKSGMVLTIEPGIYIPEEGFGVRLEDSYLVSDSSAINLFENCPILSDEIEELMNA